MADRLKNATSPYLLQHAGNPVDWWMWGDEAFAAARERDVPVLLSVGYSACHWCHVMAHESFEDPGTAALVNEHVVPIKVDREERPDVDAVYMAATQAMTGQGGWPMTVFMTPDREPFYCGTYFPRDQFRRLVAGVAQAWQERRGEVAGQARQIAQALAERAAPLRGPAGGAGQDALARAADEAVAVLAGEYDQHDGGFGGAPKFPPSMVAEFLLRRSERGGPEAETALGMVTGTAEAMARGGMYDQAGGGFARYSVDGGWVVPHFEKMLYDNALLARVYAHLWRRTGSALARRVAAETGHWLLRELRTPDGGFASALDADSDGAEGLYYTWTPAELAGVLGAQDGDWAAGVFGVTGAGTFEHGRSVLQLRADPDDTGRLARVRAALLAARQQRVPPGRDDKVVAAWNGLAIAALAETGLLLGEPSFITAAGQAADLLARVHLRDGRLDRTSRDGTASGTAGVLEDYACVADGLMVLSGVTGQPRWLGLAGQLLDVALDRFADGAGGFYDTPDDGEPLVYRPADPADGPSPSGTFAAAGALLSYAALTGSARHREAALAALGVAAVLGARYPRAAGAGLAVAEAVLSGPAEIAVVGPPGDPRTAGLHRAALLAAPPGAVLALGDGSVPLGGDGDGAGSGPLGRDSGAGRGRVGDGGGAAGVPVGGEALAGGGAVVAGGAGVAGAGVAGVPLLAGRGLVGGGPAAYVCRQFTCLAPVTTPEALRAALGAEGIGPAEADAPGGGPGLGGDGPGPGGTGGTAAEPG
jgi:uncharacterized protein